MDMAAMMEEVNYRLWRCWICGFKNHALTQKERSMAIKLLAAYYWKLYYEGVLMTSDGRKTLLDLFKEINDLIVYRLLTEPRLSLAMFTPHLVDDKRKPWPKASDICGLPPSL